MNDLGFYAFLLYQPNHSLDAYVKVVRRQPDGQSVDIAAWRPISAAPKGPVPKRRKLTVEAHGSSFKLFVD